MRAFVATATLLALCGCAPPDFEARHPGAQQGSPRAREAMGSCLQQMLASPEIQALRSKLLPLEPGSLPSQAQLADPTLVTPQEARLVLSFHQKYIVPCRQEGLARTSTIGPNPVAIVVEGFATADALILKLIEGKMTWWRVQQDNPGASHRRARLPRRRRRPPAQQSWPRRSRRGRPAPPGGNARPRRTGSASSRPWCRSSGCSIPAIRRASTTAPISVKRSLVRCSNPCHPE